MRSPLPALRLTRGRAARHALAVAAVLLAAPAARAQDAGDVKPYTLDEILDLVKSKVPNKKIVAYAKSDCIGFALDAEAVAQLRRAGAETALVDGLRSACGPKPGAATAATTAPAPARPVASAPAPASPSPSPTTPASSAPPVPVRLRAAIVGQDFSVRALPLVEFLLVGPRGDSTRVETNLDGVATAAVPPGSYRIVNRAPVELGGSRYRWSVPVTVAAGMETVELTQRNANTGLEATVASAPPVTASPPPIQAPAPAVSTAVATPASAGAPVLTAAAPSGWATALAAVPAAVAGRARAGVFAISAIHGRGTAFLVDTSGVIVTSAHLLEPDDEPRVQLDSVTRVRAKVLDVNKARGIALLRVNLKRCAGCAPLRLGAAATGSRLFVVPAPGTRGTVVSATARDARNLAADLHVVREQSGAPALGPDGGAVAFAAVVGDSSRLVPVADLASQAARYAGGPAPSDSLLPLLPPETFPASVVAAARERATLDVSDYTRQLDGFRLVLMPPQVAAYRQAQALKESAARLARGDTAALVDPIQLWSEWPEYARGSRPVVVLSVMPRANQKQSAARGLGNLVGSVTGKINVGNVDLSDDGVVFPWHGTHEIKEFYDDARAVTLLRDGEALEPVETVRLPAAINTADYQAKGKRYAWQVIQVYRAEDFAPRPGGRSARFQVAVKNANPRGAPKLYEIERGITGPVWRDLQAR